MTVVCVGQIAYKYFRKDRAKAQLILFMLLAGHELRILHMEMYNDTIVGFYVTAAIYALINDYCILGVLLLSLGMSIKLTALLLVPTFFGWIQFSRGTFMLILSIVVFLTIQLVLAGPFVNDSMAKTMGWKMGANSGWKMYLQRSKLLEDPDDFEIPVHVEQ